MPYLEHGKRRLYYEEDGEGPAILLVHSFFCSADMWRYQVPALAESHRVINVDLRGHGRSSPVRKSIDLYTLVEDTLALLDHLGVEQAIWAGLSVGGMTAMRAALVSPERVRAVILLDTDADAERSWVKMKNRPMGAGTRLLGLRPFLPAIVKAMFGPTTCRENPQLVEEWRGRFGAADVESMRHYLEALIRRDSVAPRLGEIRVPALVVVGAEDRALRPSISKRIDAGLPDSTLVEIPHAGHLCTLEQPEAVTAAMLEFLTRRVG
ncbi:MAG: alpha/beta fold hydrolase [Thermoanaerobaculia bacterium]